MFREHVKNGDRPLDRAFGKESAPTDRFESVRCHVARHGLTWEVLIVAHFLSLV